MTSPYVSTDCRVGEHELCQTRRIVPNCGCPCHEGTDALGVQRSRWSHAAFPHWLATVDYLLGDWVLSFGYSGGGWEWQVGRQEPGGAYELVARPGETFTDAAALSAWLEQVIPKGDAVALVARVVVEPPPESGWNTPL